MARINLRASEQLEYVHSVIVEWVRDICETRRVETPIGDTNALALWLAKNVTAVASDKGAAVCYREIQLIIWDIERIINRPESVRYCGPCPTCSTGLEAKRGATHVACWKCKNAYSIDDLIQSGLDSVDELLYSAEDVKQMFAGIGQPIPERTWRDWRAKDKLIVRGEREGRPAYWISDIRELLAAKPQKNATGAAVRKCG